MHNINKNLTCCYYNVVLRLVGRNSKMNKMIYTSAVALAFLISQSAEGRVTPGDETAISIRPNMATGLASKAHVNRSGSSVPVAPKAPPAPKALLAPKTKPLQASSNSRANGVAKQLNRMVKRPLDVYEYMDKITSAFNKFAEEYELKTIANIVNLYLAGNITLIREGINTAKSEIASMQTQLNQDLASLQRDNSAIINEFRPLFEEFKPLLTRLRSSINAYGRRTLNVSGFSFLREKVEAIAIKYFDKVMSIGDRLKSEPASGKLKLKSAETTLIKTVRLATGLCDLEYFAGQQKSEVFQLKNIMRNERIVKTAISLTDLNCLIKRRIKEINKEIDAGTAERIITYSDGETVTERELLTQAVNCIDNSRLSDLLAIRDKLNSRDTNDQDTEPVKRIRLLSDNIVDAQGLLKQAKEAGDTGHYSQFSKMLSNGGMALIPSVNALTAPVLSVDYNDPQARTLLSGRQLTGDISQTYVDLLSNGLFSPFSRNTLYLINSNAKNSVSSYFSTMGNRVTARTSADTTKTTNTAGQITSNVEARKERPLPLPPSAEISAEEANPRFEGLERATSVTSNTNRSIASRDEATEEAASEDSSADSLAATRAEARRERSLPIPPRTEALAEAAPVAPNAEAPEVSSVAPSAESSAEEANPRTEATEEASPRTEGVEELSIAPSTEIREERPLPTYSRQEDSEERVASVAPKVDNISSRSRVRARRVLSEKIQRLINRYDSVKDEVSVADSIRDYKVRRGLASNR